eukprot:4320697-Pleurochrysis_carterae.AAC.1
METACADACILLRFTRLRARSCVSTAHTMRRARAQPPPSQEVAAHWGRTRAAVQEQSGVRQSFPIATGARSKLCNIVALANCAPVALSMSGGLSLLQHSRNYPEMRSR